MMNQQNQNNNPDGSGDTPLKRKRGRPRKYPKPDAAESAYILLSQNKNQNPVGGETAQVPPGFERVNGNQHLQRDLDNDLNDAMVGQVVFGVIEAVFDAGYLLSVKVGDSDTTFRGLVFKPGRYVPILPENDVAPGVPMIQRNEVRFPSGTNYTQVQDPLPKERNEQYVNIHRNETHTMNGSPSVHQVPRGAVSSSNLVASSGKNVPSVADQTTPQPARGNLVPVLLQPDYLSNGVLSQVMTQPSLGSGKSVAKEIPVDGNQAPSSHIQTSQNMLSRGKQSEDVLHYQSSSNVLNEEEARSMRLPSMPFEQLVTEVVKRIQDPSDSMDIETDNSKSGDKVNEKDQSILIKPLQAIQSHPQEHSASAPKPSDNTKIGKMTELLQVLQDNKTVNQASKAEELGYGHKLDDIMNLGTELEDGGTGQSTKPF